MPTTLSFSLLHAMHQLVDQRRDQEQDHARTDQGPEPEGIPLQGRFDRHATFTADRTGEDARQVVADAGGQEPAAHAETDQAHRGQLGHHRQADRRQAQLTDGLDDVDHEQGPERDLAVHDHGRQGEHQQGEGRAVEQQAEAELARDGRIGAAQGHPDPGDDRRQGDDRHRVDRLEPRGREGPLTQLAVDDVLGQEGEGAAGLFEEHPEHDVEGEDDQHGDHTVALHLALADAFHQQQHGQGSEHHAKDPGQRGGAGGEQEVGHRNGEQRTDQHHDDAAEAFGTGRRCTDALQAGTTDVEPHQRDQHAHAGSDEHDLVGRHFRGAEDLAGQVLGQHRSDHRADVDAHVEDGEARVAAFVLQAVQLADHGRDVGLEQTVADDDRGQAELEDVLLRQRDHEQADGHDDRAGQDRALVTQYPVGHVTAEDRRGVHQRQVGAVDAAGVAFTGGVAVVELGNDVQHQRPADAVERKALPELGHEQHPQRARVAHRGVEVRQRRLWGVRSGVYAHAEFLVRWMEARPMCGEATREDHRLLAFTSNTRRLRQVAACSLNLHLKRSSQPRAAKLNGDQARSGGGATCRVVRTWNNSGKKVSSSALARKPTPDEPPVPRLKPITRITVRMWRNRHSWKAVSRSTRSSHSAYSRQ
eukprot:TRINITY_DN49050_c0_g5_i1.p1 TRINITY_DN49050_c0_g5~~TRINITY_DN49050_c0_g5_i1.p1  ORF type:complete len:645 (-),score=247.89 TRINITY_DN49050_c0_g5_i1:8-1942(-)